MNLLSEILPHSLSVTEYHTYFSLIDSGKLHPADYDSERLDALRLNKRRTERIFKTVTVSTDVSESIKAISKPVYWVVITEPWCGDSAQNLPYLVHLSTLNSNIYFSIVLRDSRPEIMDQYLTNGSSRSIPILVAFDEMGTELFRWGPRPAAASGLFHRLKAEQVEKSQIYEQLHSWYGKNKGEDVMKEMAALVNRFAI